MNNLKVLSLLVKDEVNKQKMKRLIVKISPVLGDLEKEIDIFFDAVHSLSRKSK